MLDTIRNLAKSWLAMILIGLLVISFALWGIADIFTGIGSSTVATVGDREIDARDFQRVYNNRLEVMNRNFGTPLTPQQAAAIGVPGQVLGSLVRDATFGAKADDLGLGISDERLARMIQSDPTFRGPTGSFDREYLRRVLSVTGLTESQYVLQRREQAVRNQLTEGLVGNLSVPYTYMEAFNAFQNEERSVEYIELSAAQLPALKEPTEEELKAFYEADKASFKAPELRAFRLLVVDPAAIADAATVSDEAAREEYDQAKTSRYGTPEQRNFQQLRFPDAEAARQAAARIEAGATFEEVVAEQGASLEGITLGLKNRQGILDPAIAEAVFSLPQNGVSGAIDGRFGSFIVRVTDIREGAVLPFEEVKEQIKKEIASRNAGEEVFRLYDDIEDARAGGATLQEVAQRFDLKLREVAPLDSQGRTSDGAAVELPQRQDLLQEVFRSEVDEETNPVQVGRDGFAWFNVTAIEPERERPFEEARSAVEEAWRADRLKTRLDDVANEVVSGLKAGRPLAELAGPLGAEIRSAQGITRSAAPEGVPGSLSSAAFEGPEGHVGVASESDGEPSRVVFRVTGANEPAYFEQAAGNAQARQELRSSLQDTFLAQYIRKYQDELGVSVNNQALSFVIGLDRGDGGQ